MSKKKQPKKPTTPFGTINFSKSGRVTKVVTKLPDEKSMQELEVIKIFEQQYNNLHPLFPIINIRQLSENDNDFEVTIQDKKVIVELTELVTRQFYLRIKEEEYLISNGRNYIFFPNEKLPRLIDMERNFALKELIEMKAKRYSKSTNDLWLLVFTTDIFYTTEYSEGGQLKESAAISIAKDFLKAEGPFSMVWFTNLQTLPIQVYP